MEETPRGDGPPPLHFAEHNNSLLYNVFVKTKTCRDRQIFHKDASLTTGDEIVENKGTIDSTVLLDREEDIEQAARSLKAMSHPLRLKILCTLADSEASVQDIVDTVGTSQSNISQHLAILRDKGILTARKDANRVYYRVGDPRTLRLICMMREVFCSSR